MRVPSLIRFKVIYRLGLIHKRADPRCIRKHLLEQLEPFPGQLTGESGDSGDIATGPRQAVHKTSRDWILGGDDDNGNRLGGLLRCTDRRLSSKDEEIDLQLHEFSYKVGGTLCVFLWVAMVDKDIFALYI
jgi:hypothetical protein